jgi:hypothetical protein
VREARFIGAPDGNGVAFLDRHAVAVEDKVVRECFDSLVFGGDLAAAREGPGEREAACREDGDDDQERGDAVLDDPTLLRDSFRPKGTARSPADRSSDSSSWVRGR